MHLCQRLADKKMIIIKQIPVEQMTKEERQAALNEVKVLSMLSHPNIIQYYENFLEDKALMIVMEYAQGLPLEILLWFSFFYIDFTTDVLFIFLASFTSLYGTVYVSIC